MSTEVRNAPDKNRYELLDGGEVVGFIDYEKQGDAIAFTHTEVDPARQGRGDGSTLVRGALDDVRTGGDGARVDPVCPFVAKYIEGHEEYADLVR